MMWGMGNWGRKKYYAHKTCEIDKTASIGENTKVWNDCQVREGAIIGENCILGKGVYIDAFTRIGKDCKIQNYACIYRGVLIENNVFIGPGVVFTNDLYPRANNNEWEIVHTKICNGASIGANATIRCGVKIGENSMIGAGSVVTKDIPAGYLAVGNPAKILGKVGDFEGRHD